MQKSFSKKITLVAITIACLVPLYGCAIMFPKKPTEFRRDKADEVWSLTALAEKARCRDGKHNGLHISKVKAGGNDDAPPMQNPEGPGKMSKQYIEYTSEIKMPGNNNYITTIYGVTFTFYAEEDGIIYRCDYVDERLY